MAKFDDGLIMEVEGFEEAIKKMNLLAQVDRTEYNNFKRGIKKAADPFIANVRSVIHDGRKRNPASKNISYGKKAVTYKSGNLRRSIGYIKGKGRNLIGYVGPRYGKNAKKTGDGYYGAIVNFATGRGANRSQIKERRNENFIEKGFIAGVPSANALLVREVSRILNKKIHELSMKQKKAIVKRGF